MCGLFAFSLHSQGKVCVCRVTLNLRKVLLALFSVWRVTYMYICCVLGWKEFRFLAVVSFHGSSLCVLRNLSPSRVLYNVFHKTFLFGENRDLPSPSLHLFLSLFAEHLRSLLSIKKDYCLEDSTNVTLGINLGSSIGFSLSY